MLILQNNEIPTTVSNAFGVVIKVERAAYSSFVRIEFDNIERNPASVRSRVIRFVLDDTSNIITRLKVGDKVVAKWNRPRFWGDSYIKVDGRSASIAYQGAITRADSEEVPRTATTAAPTARAVEVDRAITSAVSTPEPPDPLFGAWLASPCPLPQMEDEGLKPIPGYLRIGYITLTVDSPAESISVTEANPSEVQQTLRSSSPIIKGNWHTAQQVNISLTIASLGMMNQVLVPLIRLFKKAPFLPVENDILTDHDISALVLQSLAVQTVPGHPNVLKVDISAWGFNWENIFPSLDDARGLDALFNYPLLKIWAERPDKWDEYLAHETQESLDSVLNYLPQITPWNGVFRLSPLMETDLKQALTLPAERTRAGHWNSDLDLIDAGQSKVLADVPDNKPVGFTPLDSTDTAVSRLLILDNKARLGRVNLDPNLAGATPGTYLFIRPRTQRMAEHLAISNGFVGVITGPVRITTNPTPSSTSLYKSVGWTTILPDEVRRDYLPKESTHHSTFGMGLEAGAYTFVISGRTTSGLKNEKSKAWQKITVPADHATRSDYSFAIDPEVLFVENIQAEVSNTIAPLQVRGQETPNYQYMGSTNINYQISGMLTDVSHIGQIKKFMSRLTELARKYHGSPDVPYGGMAKVENELFRMLGTRYVIPTSFQTSTMDDRINSIRFTMTLMEFDPTERSKELLTDLNRDKNTEAAARGVASLESEQDSFLTRYLERSAFREKLKRTELYPDLKLPTHARITEWLEDIKAGKVWDFEKNEAAQPKYRYLEPRYGGTGWQWSLDEERRDPVNGLRTVMPLPDSMRTLKPPRASNRQRFADPDFYCASSEPWGTEAVETSLKKTLKDSVSLVDYYGTELKMTPGVHVDDKRIVKDDQNAIQQATAATVDIPRVRPKGSSPGPLDQARYPSARSTGALTSADTTTGVDGSVLNPTKAGAGVRGDLARGKATGLNDKLIKAANRHGLPPAYVLAIASRETGIQNIIGDNTHGHGVIQIDDRTRSGHRAFFNAHPGDDAHIRYVDAFIEYGVRLLSDEAANVRAKFSGISQREILKRAACAYNAGFQGMLRGVNEGDADLHTANHNYGSDVLRRMDEVASILGERNGAGAVHPDITSAAGLLAGTSLRESEIALVERFSNGQAFLEDDIAAWMDRSEATIQGNPNNALRRSNAFIKSNWLTKVYEGTRQDFSLGVPGSVGSAATTPGMNTRLVYYTLATPQALAEFCKNPDHIKVRLSNIPTSEAADVVRNNMAQLRKALDADRSPTQEEAKSLGFNTQGLRHGDGPQPVSAPEAFYNKEGEDMLHSMRRSLIQGRLLGCFPTFYVAIVDGGRTIRVWRLFDHVYGALAVTRIDVHRTARAPVDVAVVGFSNMFGMMTALHHDMARIEAADVRGDTLYEYFEGMVSRARSGIDGETLAFWSQQIHSLMLRSGARLHLRLGFGSDASELPVVFNGVISEVTSDEGEVQAVGLSDGVELTNDLPPTTFQNGQPVYQQNSLFGEGLNPRDIIMNIMVPGRDALAATSIAARTSNVLGSLTGLPFLYFNFRNEHGIEHFGRPLRQMFNILDGESGVNVYNPEHMNPFNGSDRWENTLRTFQVMNWSTIDKLIGINMESATPWAVFDTCRRVVPDYTLAVEPMEFRSTLFYGKPWFPHYYDYHDIDDLSDNALRSLLGDAVKDPARMAALMSEAGRPTTTGTNNPALPPGVDEHGHTWSWTVGGVELITLGPNAWTPTPGSVLMPFGRWLANTIAPGSVEESGAVADSDHNLDNPQFQDPGTFMKRKTFCQLHMLTSDWNMIGQEVRADGSDVITKCQAVGTKNGWIPGPWDLSAEAGYVMMVDEDIYDEFQKMKMVESGLYSTLAMKAGDGMQNMDLARFGIDVAAIVGGLLAAGTGIGAAIAVGGTADLLSGPLKSFFQSRRVLDFYAASYLKDSVSTMYQGPVAVLGNGYIKPRDIVSITDRLTGLNGLAGVAEVTHSLSLETGYVTEVVPSCLSQTVFDPEGMDFWMWGAVAASNIAVATAIKIAVGKLARMTSQKVLLASLRALRTWANSVENPGSEIITLRARLNNIIPNKGGLNGDLRSVLQEVAENPGFEEAPFQLKARIEGQRYLLEAKTWSSDKVKEGLGALDKQIDPNVTDSLRQVYDKAIAEEAATKAAVNDAIKDVSASEVKDIKTLSKYLAKQEAAGTALTAEEKVAQTALQAFEEKSGILTRVLRAAPFRTAQFARGALAVPNYLLGSAAGRVLGQGIVMAGIMAVCGGIADYIKRWAAARQCLTIMPLRIYDREWSAGIEGHRGAVVGDIEGPLDKTIETVMDGITGKTWAAFFPILNELATNHVRYHYDAPPVQMLQNPAEPMAIGVND